MIDIMQLTMINRYHVVYAWSIDNMFIDVEYTSYEL